jgi:hypothetical protein
MPRIVSSHVFGDRAGRSVERIIGMSVGSPGGGVEFAGSLVRPGERRTVEIVISRRALHGPATLPVHVLHGVSPGPTIFVSAAIHGDEINGVEIIRRLLRGLDASMVHGTLLCVPIVNALGFIGRSRYLPDRRDLNRSFPGGPAGSLAAQIAHAFMTEIVQRCDVGLDLHTAAAARTNLPQLRTSLSTARARMLAKAFGAPVVLRSPERPGSLRAAAGAIGCDVLVYEAGEALRFDNRSIQIGERGVRRVMSALGMLDASDPPTDDPALPDLTAFSNRAKWVRAPDGGILRTHKTLGDPVAAGEVVGVISNPYDHSMETPVSASTSGIIIGRTNLPVVNLGDALFHIASVDIADASAETISRLGDAIDADPVFDEDEII